VHAPEVAGARLDDRDAAHLERPLGRGGGGRKAQRDGREGAGDDEREAVEAADQATPAVIRDEDLHDPLEGAGGEPPTPGAAEGEADETARVFEPGPEAPIDITPY
jgi:hypothetical protein